MDLADDLGTILGMNELKVVGAVVDVLDHGALVGFAGLALLLGSPALDDVLPFVQVRFDDPRHVGEGLGRPTK